MLKKYMSVGEAESKARDFVVDENYDELYNLVDTLLQQDKVLGSENDYHNFCLKFSRLDDDETACNILAKGLQQYPNEIDLLADFLQMGRLCSRLEECEKYKAKLLSIPKTVWTWRGFSFLIDYMLYTSGNLEIKKIEVFQKELLALADEYCLHFPGNEDAYMSKADIYEHYNNHSKVKQVLEEALEKIAVCPKCALRLADIYFKEGRYEEVLLVVNKCLYMSVETQNSINRGYLFYLSGLCKTIKLFQSGNFSDEAAVKDVYVDFNISKEIGVHTQYKKNIDREIRILELKSGIENEY